MDMMTTRHLTALAAVLTLTLAPTVACDPSVDGGGGAGEGEGEGEGEPGAEPLSVEDEAWIYSVVDGARCGNGGDVGVATNRGSSDRLVIYLEGGGACWDQFTCGNGFASFVRSGIPQSTITQITSLSVGIFNRGDADSPFVADSFAYVPYCTGDVHGGTRPDTPWGVAHVGGDNLDVMLPRILATFPAAREVVLAGTSAGGYGVGMNIEKLAGLLPAGVGLTALMDSAIPLPPFAGAEAVVTAQNSAWQPEDCGPDCVNALDRFEARLAALPQVRFGLIQSLGDTTLRQFYAAGLTPVARQSWADAVSAFFDDFAGRDNVDVFEIDVDRHVFVYEADLGSVVVDGTSLGNFMKGVVGDAAPVDVRVPVGP
jgi:hypothetical protein